MNDQTMRSAQLAYDNMAEPEPDDDGPLTEDEAEDQARDELERTPATALFHLGHLCAESTEPIPLSELFDLEFDTYYATADKLLVMILQGEYRNAKAAIRELNRRLYNRMKPDIKERAAELLRADERMREHEPNEDDQS